MANSLIQLWKNKGKILEGIKNSIFTNIDVEHIAAERLEICRSKICNYYDSKGESEKVILKGKESCAFCGCNLSFKVRSLSSYCDDRRWNAVLSQEEDDALVNSLNKDGSNI